MLHQLDYLQEMPQISEVRAAGKATVMKIVPEFQRGPKCTILFTTTIVFTIVSSSPITTVLYDLSMYK